MKSETEKIKEDRKLFKALQEMRRKGGKTSPYHMNLNNENDQTFWLYTFKGNAIVSYGRFGSMRTLLAHIRSEIELKKKVKFKVETT